MTQPIANEVNDAPEIEASQKEFTLVRHVVTIHREAMTSIADTIYDHELAILNEIESEGAVEIAETYEVAVPDFDVGQEFERLQTKYRNRSPDIVQKIFGRTPKGLAVELGIGYRPQQAEKYVEPQSMVVEHKDPTIKRVIKKAAPKVPAKKKSAR